jgi:rhamnosyl/mannosyltransferase
MLLTPYYPPHLGGVQMYVRGLAEGLTRLGCQVIVVTSGPVRVCESDGDITVERLPARWHFSNTPVDPRWVPWLQELVRRYKPDVINAHTPVPFMVDLAAWVRGSVPLVVTYHAASLRKSKSPLFNLAAAVYSRVERATLNRSAAVIAVSDYVAGLLRQRHLKPTVFTVPNSIWVPQRRPAAPGRARVSDRTGSAVFLSSLDRSHDWKGLAYLLEAIAHIARVRPQAPVELVVVGDGSERARYEELSTRLGVAHLIQFEGAQFGVAKDAIISAADLLVTYPDTSNDAFPTVFLEAWALGVPVLTADIEPMPSILRSGEEAVLVPPADPVALASCLMSVLDDVELRDRLSGNGFRCLLDHHDWTVNAQVTLDLFRSVASPV